MDVLLWCMLPGFSTRAFLTFLLRSRSWTHLHSTSLYTLFDYIEGQRKNTIAFQPIEDIRAQLLGSNEIIQRTDHGAGSRVMQSRSEKVRSIAMYALSRPGQCRFMHHLAKHRKAASILEFGTSLGISTAYLASSNPQVKVITVEGDPAVAKIADNTFQKLALSNVKLHYSTFQAFLDDQLSGQSSFDIIFIDGHHEKFALQHYARSLLPFCHSKTILVIDDINWSADMNEAWREMQGWKEFTQSVDLFHFGLLFLDPDFLNVQHHVIRSSTVLM